MTDQPSSRSSSRARSLRDIDTPSTVSTSTPATATTTITSDKNSAIPQPSSAAVTSTKRDASYSSRASTATRGNLSNSGVLSGYQSLHSSRPPSSATSPRSSREPSPAFRHASANNAMTTPRARKNSIEVSPQRSQPAATVTPSAAAIQRALSRETAPQLQPTTSTAASSTTEPNIRVARPLKPKGSDEGRETPSWPISPRLRSPPSSSPRRSSARGSKRQEDGMTLDGTVRRKSPDAMTDVTNVNTTQPTTSKPTASRSLTTSTPYLETVQESSVPPTPLEDSSRSSSRERQHEYFSFNSSLDEARPTTARRGSAESLEQLTPKASNNNGKSFKKNEDYAMDSEPPAKSKLLSKNSPTKSDVKTAAEPVSKNMTVETETVSSIPQATLGPSTDRSISGKTELGGTLRVKASTETIRPRKERKKASKKAASVNAGSSSTRADIFEDRVKNAMDEATSDDSDETFVYESNPPDPPPGRSRHHSRTPSGASLSSMPDRTVMRSIANAIEQQRSVPKTRSMKFSSNASNYGAADEDLDNNGTVRASHRNGHSAIQHHFRGTSRTNTGSHLAADDEANMVPLSKTKSLTAVGGRGSYAARLAAQNLRHSSTMKRNDGYASLDIDAEGGDDERTPLMGGTIRTARGNNRSLRGRPRGYEPQYLRREERRSLMSRFAGCFIILSTLSILIFGVVCFLFAMSKPLNKVAIYDLKSIIASEQELMFDVVIQAVNPNLVPITMMDLSVNLFARSKYAGSERWWREHGQPPPALPHRGEKRKTKSLPLKRIVARRRQQMSESAKSPDHIDLDDPVSKPTKPSHGQTLLLGEILHFDNPIIFDGSFWRRQMQYGRGSIRLSKPANQTEAGGTERWENVLKHDFDLIMRGTLKYQIPLGGRTVTVPIDGEKSVKGNGSEDDDDRPSGDEYEWLSNGKNI